ncbi:SUMF1/EgtB/PvdO family nonheme iron enzyme [Nitrosomonas sp.]|uniref:SUMF1/EgtB/PvdO family nonheme iron enzyme n=1 Tax=Nitrosomonas sp. TaxID=42353 RepID=UPI00283E8224|nr:SUMF1/EgtB/PvdO family nonheme iron enzyme [Nitrosomonas sp.]MDR4513124.1 SUMF1/EgtB/PvdO family nonheme iron enzyme [Nitrosomonas sp.]
MLRRLELDLASSALRSDDVNAPLTMFLPLNDFGDKNGFPKPLDWIKEYWNQNEKFWLSSEDLLRQPFILLLDGLNEMPRVDRADYDDRLAAWKNFLNNLALNHPSVRVIFSCRTLDYGTKLTTKDLPCVPQVEITPLDDSQVEKFLKVYSPDAAAHLWEQLKGSEQLDLYRSPYYLRLLIDQTSDGRIPEGRAALFTGFVRTMLKREIDNVRLRNADWLLTKRDLNGIGQWRSAYELPYRGVLFNALADFAFQLQTQRSDGDTENTGNKMQVRIDFDGALDCLSTRIPDESQCENLLNAAVDLQILDMPGDDVLFVHQLLQEYFAARHLAEAANKTKNSTALAAFTNLASVAWLEADISPTVREILQTLPKSGTLSDLPTTGWEETFMLAAAMTDAPDDFLRALAQVNLPLAGRCAAQPDVKVSDELRRDLQQRLIARSRDPATDLRARIHAGDALGRLGDLRIELRQGEHGRYLLPPMIEIEGGIYSIGSDEGIEEDEAPRHDVELAPFALAQFPVTSAEFKYFIDSGGYDDERWWDTPQAQRWRRGEGTGESDRENWRYWRNRFKNDTAFFTQFVDEQAWTEELIQRWNSYFEMTDEAFEAMLRDRWPHQRFTLPRFWNDPKLNAPNQPVVGICWFEARAYCAWLSAQTGQHYRLPTEVEWEAAASGKVGRRYPWGDVFDATMCNTIETRLRRVTPVDVFPASDTPPSASEAAIADLPGNVWEWTGSGYQAYPYRADDGREAVDGDNIPRVLRGGSWFDGGRDCRSACRDRDDPSNRNRNSGFRLARGH